MRTLGSSDFSSARASARALFPLLRFSAFMPKRDGSVGVPGSSVCVILARVPRVGAREIGNVIYEREIRAASDNAALR